MKKYENYEENKQKTEIYDQEYSDYEEDEDKFVFKMDEDTPKSVAPITLHQTTPATQPKTAHPYGYSNFLKELLKSQQPPKSDPNIQKADPTPPKQYQTQSRNVQPVVTMATVKATPADHQPSKKAEASYSGLTRTKPFTSYDDLLSLIGEKNTPQQTHKPEPEPTLGVLRSLIEYFYPEEDEDTYSP